jgi:ABC-type uncharacterized transport system permease subunit
MTLERLAVSRFPAGMKALEEQANKSLLGYVLVAIALGLAIGEPTSTSALGLRMRSAGSTTTAGRSGGLSLA